jgi:hypothetical protein
MTFPSFLPNPPILFYIPTHICAVSNIPEFDAWQPLALIAVDLLQSQGLSLSDPNAMACNVLLPAKFGANVRTQK